MKSVFRILPVAGLLAGLAFAGLPTSANAQQQQPKPCTPAAATAAAEILKMKNANQLYASIVPNVVMQTKEALTQANLNYQKDLNEVAPLVAQALAGKEKEVGDGMAFVYCNEFTEQELKDIVTFYKTPLGQKMLSAEPRAIQGSMAYVSGWAKTFAETVNAEFRAQMRKRGKQI
jgi:hypothetical protein